MQPSIPANTSGTTRLMLGALGHQVGWTERLILPAPAAGAQWKYTADGRYFERILSVGYTFTASAVVGNRFLSVQLTDNNGLVITKIPGGDNVAAAGVPVVWLTVGSALLAQGPNGDTFGSIPDFLIPPGWSWGSQVFGMDVGDQFSQVVLMVQRYPNDAAQQII